MYEAGMGWRGIAVRHADGRTGRVRLETGGYGHMVLTIAVDGGGDAVLRLNDDGTSDGASGWGWLCPKFDSGLGGPRFLPLTEPTPPEAGLDGPMPRASLKCALRLVLAHVAGDHGGRSWDIIFGQLAGPAANSAGDRGIAALGSWIISMARTLGEWPSGPDSWAALTDLETKYGSLPDPEEWDASLNLLREAVPSSV